MLTVTTRWPFILHAYSELDDFYYKINNQVRVTKLYRAL